MEFGGFPLWYVPLIWTDFLFALTLDNINVFTIPEGERARVLACSSIAIRISSAHPYATVHRLVGVELRDIPFYFRHCGQSPCMKPCPTVSLEPPAALYDHAVRMPTMTQIPRMNSVSPCLPVILFKMAPASAHFFQVVTKLYSAIQAQDRLTVSLISSPNHRTLDMSIFVVS